jgi:hypothetical protein
VDDVRNMKKIHQAKVRGGKKRGGGEGRPRTGWKVDVENGIRKMEIVNWRKIAQDRDEWRATREALSEATEDEGNK